MAVTKIHPIKSTLFLAISYITDREKTDKGILVSSHKCNPLTAHTQFLKTREANNTRGTILARHLIQSFAPEETTPEEAHKIGLELCQNHLKGEYEFVLTTHIDKGHIHNHIIFNNVNMITGRCYQSNKKSYHQIRYQSDKLCRKYNLSVIDESYEIYKKKYKTSGRSWYEQQQFKKGTSWKSKLQFDIDRMIERSKSWDDFLFKMSELGYEIKHGKHIAFKHKDKVRFTRAKRIGEDYTEERLKERIQLDHTEKSLPTEKQLEHIIDMSNQKVQSNKGYEHWALKHNLKTMSNALLYLHKKGFKSIVELNEKITETEQQQKELLTEIKTLEEHEKALSQTMDNLYTIKKYRHYYQMYKEKTSDMQYANEYKKEISMYLESAKRIASQYEKVPNSKEILSHLENVNKQKETLIIRYEENNKNLKDMRHIHKNYTLYMKPSNKSRNQNER